VDEVILVGGATRMPMLREYVRDVFEKEPLASWDPDHVVALGAAIQSALMLDDRSVEDMVMTDVCPFTLGVEVCKEFGTHLQEGYYLPLIHRNTTIPVSREEVVSTVRGNQREVQVRIYQGESRRVKENLYLGELEVKGIPPSKAGQPVHIRFTYDLNGILEVEAFLPATGKKFQTVLTHHVKGLSPDAVKKAVQNLQKLKFYPRDEAGTQNLIRFAERVVGEVNPYDRKALEEELDRFEAVCSMADRELFRQCRQALVHMLADLGFPPGDDIASLSDDAS
jgi:molecular chaperone HscC